MDEIPLPASDADLIARYLRDRSEEAFRSLVERHAGMVHAACARGLGRHAALADDAAQAVFMVLARKAGLIRNPDAVGGWLFHISRTVVANLLREEERRRRREEAAGRRERSRPVEDRERTWGMALPYLDEGIASLPAAQRDAVVLHCLEGVPQQEAARRLGCAQSSLHERISTALGKLRQFFARKGVVLSAAALAAGLSGLAAPAATAAVVTACAAAGGGAAVSVGAATLAQGALKALFTAKLKAAVALVVCATAAAAGGGMAVRALVAPDPPTMAAAPAREPAAPAAEAPAPLLPPADPTGQEIVLEQIISREDARFSCPPASLNVGRDGLVYLSSGGNTSYVLRLGRDGKGKFGQPIVYAAKNATANADGMVASANGHFAHKVTLYDRQLQQTSEVSDFLVNDKVGWDAPAEVEAGAGGDFYGIDQHRDRILRINPAGKVVRAFAIAREPAAPQGQLENLRVCEAKQLFYVLARGGGIRCVGFDGKTRWSRGFGLAGQWYIGSRAFDCDDEGVLHVLENGSDTVKKFGADGKPAGEVKLQLGERKPPPGKAWFFALRASRGDLLVRCEHPTELFQVYNAATGAFKNAVHIDHERLAARLPGAVWTAGRTHPFKVEFQASGPAIAPRWRLWLRPIEVPSYRELKLANDQVEVPADLSGLYRLKLTPEVQPWERGLAAQVASEYLLQSVVEVRPPEARGSVTVLTPGNRAYYGQGEPVPFSAAARAAEKDRDVPVTLKLLDGPRAVAEVKASLKTNASPQPFALPSTLTLGLRPGNYVLAAEAPGFACASQPIVVGPPPRDPPYFIAQYGDYGFTFPSNATFWNAPDAAAAQAARLDKLRINLMVDRIGTTAFNAFAWDNNVSNPAMEALAKRLAADPLAVSPDKARAAVPFLQCLGAYGASGVRHMGILMGMDAGLPLGTGFDNRKPDQLAETIRKNTEAVRPYGAYRGWTWSSNWWVFDKRGAAAAKTPAEKSAYEAALKKARETGVWDPILDQVAAHRLGLAAEAQELFNQALKKIAPDAGYRTAVAAPYRNVESYPPVTFGNVDEVDLHIQWEQMGVPYHGPHNVDFYKRPGKRGWAHPEIWNDDGTGGQVTSVLFQIAMRGADGVGFSGELPPWAGHGGGLPDDPRVAHYGHASVYRALNSLFRAYGPLFAATENDDRVAIAASGRMYKIDDWSHVTGHHFARQMEAYISCLHAHHPASIVFAEDLKPDSLRRFKAILLVDERVELEPELLAALRAAKTAGAAVFYDRTCRESVVKEFAPLDVAFDKLDKDRSPAGDDAAYWRFSGYGTANVPALRRALDPVTPPAAAVDDPEILVTQRKAEGARYLWVANNTLPRLDPGQLWRMNLAVTTRVPLVAPVRLAADAKAVYDVFAMKQVPPGGALSADLRSLPARLYALLPAPIAQVEARAPRSVPAGAPFRWQAAAQDEAGQPIAALVPFRVRLLAADGRVLAEEFAAGGSKGAGGAFTAPLNAPGPLALEATELFSGRTAKATVETAPAPAPAIVAGSAPPAAPPAPAEASVRTAGRSAADFPAAETSFGPHLRDLVVAEGGKLAVMNAMNWDHNLYAMDTETGRLRWRQRAGHYFAFAPQALANGVAVQGFDFKTAEGYHLYVVGHDGKPERRFALYGVPKRLPFRFVPGIGCEDRQGLGGWINNFACPPDGSWVAAAGDLGLAVWTREGQLRWRQDAWKTKRAVAALAAPDAETLVAAEGVKVRFLSAADGKPKGELSLGASGEVRKIVFGGPFAAVLATTEGGRATVLRESRIERAFATPCEDAGLSPDGGLLAVVTGNQLKLYSVARGLQWTFAGDDRLRFPRFAPDGRRLAVTSDLGSAYVFDPDGKALWEADLGARAVPAWLPGGDLLLAGWMGRVLRIGADFKIRWETRLQPEAPDMRERLLADDGAPTAKIPGWGTAEAASSALDPNLIAKTPVIVKFVPSGGWGGEAQFAQDPKALFDGKPDAPPNPWIDWSYVGFFAETSPVNYVLIDAFRRQLRVSAVTFVEDRAHPESWLRDARFEYWDAAAEKWALAAEVLADAPAHTHRLPKPVEAARFRILLPWGAVGNLRLGEVVFHGEILGCSHPDAAAKRAAAVLFDEQDDLKRDLIWGGNGLSFKLDAAFSGGRCLALAGGRKVAPLYQPPFGHFIANWDFEIAEKPQPGQYRWLQFAWKAASGKAKGITLGVGGEGIPNTAFHAGEPTEVWQGMAARKIGDAPPAEWKVERVDLWEAFGKKPGRLQALYLGAAGDGALFDQIVLARGPQDFPPPGAAGR